MKKTVFLMTIIGVVLLPLLAMAAQVGTFTSVSGRVDIAGPDQVARLVKVGDSVDEGDVVRTKSSAKAEITFNDDNILRLAEKTRVVISEYVSSDESLAARLTLSRGKVQNIVRKTGRIFGRLKKNRFEVHTPTAVVGVRGTNFFTYFQRGVSGAAFLEGEGYGYNPNMPDRVELVTAGQALLVASTDAVPETRDAADPDMDRHIQDTSPRGDEGDDDGGGGDDQGGIPAADNNAELVELKDVVVDPRPEVKKAVERVLANQVVAETLPTEVKKYIADNVPFTTVLTAKPAAVTNSATADFVLRAVGGTAKAYAYKFDDFNGTLQWFVTTDPAVQLTGLGEGLHQIQYAAVDAGGNRTTVSTYRWTTDYTPPEVGFSSTPATLTNTNSGTFGVTSSETVTYQYGLDGSQVTSTTVSGLSEGQHTFGVLATDAAGNTGTATYTWETDYTAPAVTLTNTPAVDTSLDAANIGVSSNETVTYEYTLNGSIVAGTSLTGLGEGHQTLIVSATDAAGNTGTATYTWTTDYTDPSVSLSNTPAAKTNASSSNIGVSSSETVTYTYDLDGNSVASSSLTGLSEGAHTLTVTATDSAGNSATASYSWITDYTAPDVTLSNIPATVTNADSANIDVSSDETVTYTYTLDGNAVGGTTLAGLNEGGHILEVTATDEAGNSTTVIHAWNTDYTAPDVLVTDQMVSSPGSTADVDVTLGSSATDAAGYSWSLDNGAQTGTGSAVNLIGLADGSHTLTFTATDNAGNVSSEETFTFELYNQGYTGNVAGSGSILTGTSEGAFGAVVDSDWGGWASSVSGTYTDGPHSGSWNAVSGGDLLDGSSSRVGLWLERIDGAASTAEFMALTETGYISGTGTVDAVFTPTTATDGTWDYTTTGSITDTSLVYAGHFDDSAGIAPSETGLLDNNSGLIGWGGDLPDTTAYLGLTGPLTGPAELHAIGDFWDEEMSSVYLWSNEIYGWDLATDGWNSEFAGYTAGFFGDENMDGAIVSLYTTSTESGVFTGDLSGWYSDNLGMWTAGATVTPVALGPPVGTASGIGVENYVVGMSQVYSDNSYIDGAGYLITAFFDDWETVQPWGIYNLQLGMDPYNDGIWNTYYTSSGDPVNLSGLDIAIGGVSEGDSGIWIGTLTNTEWAAGRFGADLAGRYLTDSTMGSFGGPFYGLYDLPDIDPGTWVGAGVGTFEGAPLAFSGSADGSLMYTEAGGEGAWLFEGGHLGGLLGGLQNPLQQGVPGSITMMGYSYDGYDSAFDPQGNYLMYGSGVDISGALSGTGTDGSFYGYYVGNWRDGEIDGRLAAIYVKDDGELGLETGLLSDARLASLAGDGSGNVTIDANAEGIPGFYYPDVEMWEVEGATMAGAAIDATSVLPADLVDMPYSVVEEQFHGEGGGSFDGGALLFADQVTGDPLRLVDQEWGVWNMGIAGWYDLGEAWVSNGWQTEMGGYYDTEQGFWLGHISGTTWGDPDIYGLYDGMAVTEDASYRFIGEVFGTRQLGIYGSWQAAGIGTYEMVPNSFSSAAFGSLFIQEPGTSYSANLTLEAGEFSVLFYGADNLWTATSGAPAGLNLIGKYDDYYYLSGPYLFGVTFASSGISNGAFAGGLGGVLDKDAGRLAGALYGVYVASDNSGGILVGDIDYNGGANMVHPGLQMFTADGGVFPIQMAADSGLTPEDFQSSLDVGMTESRLAGSFGSPASWFGSEYGMGKSMSLSGNNGWGVFNIMYGGDNFYADPDATGNATVAIAGYADFGAHASGGTDPSMFDRGMFLSDPVAVTLDDPDSRLFRGDVTGWYLTPAQMGNFAGQMIGTYDSNNSQWQGVLGAYWSGGQALAFNGRGYGNIFRTAEYVSSDYDNFAATDPDPATVFYSYSYETGLERGWSREEDTSTGVTIDTRYGPDGTYEQWSDNNGTLTSSRGTYTPGTLESILTGWTPPSGTVPAAEQYLSLDEMGHFDARLGSTDDLWSATAGTPAATSLMGEINPEFIEVGEPALVGVRIESYNPYHDNGTIWDQSDPTNPVDGNGAYTGVLSGLVRSDSTVDLDMLGVYVDAAGNVGIVNGGVNGTASPIMGVWSGNGSLYPIELVADTGLAPSQLYPMDGQGGIVLESWDAGYFSGFDSGGWFIDYSQVPLAGGSSGPNLGSFIGWTDYSYTQVSVVDITSLPWQVGVLSAQYGGFYDNSEMSDNWAVMFDSTDMAGSGFLGVVLSRPNPSAWDGNEIGAIDTAGQWSNNEISGKGAAAWVSIDAAMTGIGGADLKGTFNPANTTWQMAAAWVTLDTDTYLAMTATAAGREDLGRINIPCIEVGRTTLSGGDAVLTDVHINDATFFAYSTNAAPTLWGSGDVGGAYASIPTAGHTVALTGNAGLSADFTVNNWSGNNPNTWDASVTGSGAYTGSGSMNGSTVSFDGFAAGALTPATTTSGSFAGTAAGVVTPPEVVE